MFVTDNPRILERALSFGGPQYLTASRHVLYTGEYIPLL